MEFGQFGRGASMLVQFSRVGVHFCHFHAFLWLERHVEPAENKNTSHS